MYFSYWKGMKYALFTYNSNTNRGVADFNWFHYIHDGPQTNLNPSPPPLQTPTLTPTPSYTVYDLKLLLSRYLTNNSSSDYYPKDAKVNMLDTGYVISNLLK